MEDDLVEVIEMCECCIGRVVYEFKKIIIG